MEKKNYELPPIAWLKVTDYMLAWMQYELGGGARVRDMKVVCVQHLPGARDVLKMETTDDMELKPVKVAYAMSGSRKNMLEAGLALDPDYVEQAYGVTAETMKLFVPIECPKMCLTKYGVLRPWTLDVSFGREQACAMQRLLRAAFWQAVEEFNEGYARKMEGKKYHAIDMVEDFCAETGTSDIYAEAIRREWQRRVKRIR